MKKIIFFSALFLFLPVLYLTAGPVPVKAETIELKFAHFMSPKHIQHQKSFDPFAQKVAELTNGQVQIKIYPGGALGGPKQLPDAVKTGITDIAFIIPSYTTARFPRISALDLPFLCDSAAQTTEVVYDLYDRHFAADFTDYKVLWLYSAGPGQLQSATKAMNTAEALNGMKMRAPSAYMSKALKMLGANPVGMPISKLTMSLQKKVIDGMLTPYSAVQDFRLFDLVTHITELNMYVTPMAVVMNSGKYNALPDFAKKALDEASGKQWGLHAAKVYDDHDGNTLKEIIKQGKINVYKLPEAEKQKIASMVKPLEAEWIAEASKQGVTADQILADVKKSAQNN
jgi:TRAP-type C4-dicarboxylate transport system substrate-binding protein